LLFGNGFAYVPVEVYQMHIHGFQRLILRLPDFLLDFRYEIYL
jgi:hypothetical protein